MLECFKITKKAFDECVKKAKEPELVHQNGMVLINTMNNIP